MRAARRLRQEGAPSGRRVIPVKATELRERARRDGAPHAPKEVRVAVHVVQVEEHVRGHLVRLQQVVQVRAVAAQAQKNQGSS